jgi:hypothetical protein
MSSYTSLVLTTVAAATAVSFPASASTTASELAPDAWPRAQAIRANVNGRYRRISGRKLVVTEVAAMGVVDSLTLVTIPLEPARVVPADNGIYFAVCPVRARCPYPKRAAAWPAIAFRPRCLAVELAVRTFLGTSADLVVVALPTRSPVWVVFERHDLFAEVGAPLLDQLTADPALADAGLRAEVDRLTRYRLFAPLVLNPIGSGQETFLAMSLFVPQRKE